MLCAISLPEKPESNQIHTHAWLFNHFMRKCLAMTTIHKLASGIERLLLIIKRRIRLRRSPYTRTVREYLISYSSISATELHIPTTAHCMRF